MDPDLERELRKKYVLIERSTKVLLASAFAASAAVLSVIAAALFFFGVLRGDVKETARDHVVRWFEEQGFGERELSDVRILAEELRQRGDVEASPIAMLARLAQATPDGWQRRVYQPGSIHRDDPTATRQGGAITVTKEYLLWPKRASAYLELTISTGHSVQGGGIRQRWHISVFDGAAPSQPEMLLDSGNMQVHTEITSRRDVDGEEWICLKIMAENPAGTDFMNQRVHIALEGWSEEPFPLTIELVE